MLTTTSARALIGLSTVVRAVRAYRLPPQAAHRRGDVDELLTSIMFAANGSRWPEHQHRYVMELVSEDVSGWYGPVSEAVLTILRDNYAAGLLGHDALAHRRLLDRPIAGRHHSGPHAAQARSAIDLACWDLASRATGQAVTALMGGTAREVVPAYASALGLDACHAAAPEAAQWIAAAGFWGQKWALTKAMIEAGPHAIHAHLSRIRAAAPETRIMIDGLGRCRIDQALALLPVLADLQVSWAEELVDADGPAWKSLRSHAHAVPVAAGEHAYDAN